MCYSEAGDSCHPSPSPSPDPHQACLDWGRAGKEVHSYHRGVSAHQRHDGTHWSAIVRKWHETVWTSSSPLCISCGCFPIKVPVWFVGWTLLMWGRSSTKASINNTYDGYTEVCLRIITYHCLCAVPLPPNRRHCSACGRWTALSCSSCLYETGWSPRWSAAPSPGSAWACCCTSLWRPASSQQSCTTKGQCGAREIHYLTVI